MPLYCAYQLIISSEWVLPELCSANGIMEGEQPTITLSFGEARRESVPTPRIHGLYYQLQPEIAWLEIPNIARFLIRHGRQIIVEPLPGADEDSVRLFLYTSCIPLVLIYHNFFLLHGGAIRGGEQGVAFLSDFGQGKSTLLASFLKRDYRFLSDDICVLNQEGELLPGIPYLQLGEDTIKNLDIDGTARKLIRPALQKWYIPVPDARDSKPSLLKKVYIINSSNRSEPLFTPLVGLKKILCLKKYTYLPLFVKGLGKDLLYFQQCAALAGHITATYVERGTSKLQWDAFAELIEQDLHRV